MVERYDPPRTTNPNSAHNLPIGNLAMITQRQLQVLRMYAQGMKTINIAAELNLSIRTVEEHLRGCRIELGAVNSVNAVAIGIERGIIELLILISLWQAVTDNYACDMRRPPKTSTRVVRVMRMRDKDARGRKDGGDLEVI